MKKITICGGGSLGHVCIGFLSSQENLSVDLLTNHPEKWNRVISVKDVNGKVFEGRLGRISSNPQEVIPDADLVILCLPGFLIKQTLEQIKPYLSEKTVVGSIVSSTGFFFFAHEVLGENAELFGFQRVPFIARVVEYGKSANLLGYKSSLNIAVENVEDKESFRSFVEASFNTPVNLLQSFYEACLTNSNPILHTGRLYSMWRNWDGKPYDHCILFYKEWTEDAAQWLIDMDAEFMRLLDKLPMNQKAVPSLLEYYESTDAKSLAAKLSSIKAFETIKAPMKELEKGWVPDFESRYFTEDFPFGLRFIVDLARKHGVETPKIDIVYEWGMKKVYDLKPCFGCGRQSELQKSHIIPEFFYKYVYSKDHKFILVSDDADDSKLPKQKGLREKLLCHDCEESLSKQERVTAAFFKELTSEKYTSLNVETTYGGILIVKDYDYLTIKKCLLSILWRASISKEQMFSNYNLGPYNDKIKKYIFSDDDIPWNVFPIHVSKVKLGEKYNAGLILCHEKGSYDSKTMYSLTLAGYSFAFYVVENMLEDDYKPYFMNEEFCSIMEVSLESIMKSSVVGRFKDVDVKNFFEKCKR